MQTILQAVSELSLEANLIFAFTTNLIYWFVHFTVTNANSNSHSEIYVLIALSLCCVCVCVVYLSMCVCVFMG